MARAQGIAPDEVKSAAQRSLDAYSESWRAAEPSVKRVLATLAKAEPSLEALLGVLQRIEDDAPPEVDGCRMLWEVYGLQRQAPQSEQMNVAKHYLGGRGEVVGCRLKPMRAAADAMMVWLERRAAEPPRRKRPKPPFNQRQQDRDTYERWERAYEHGMSADDFAIQNGMTPDKFKKLRNRVQQRNHRHGAPR
jgi:hypothetical protein